MDEDVYQKAQRRGQRTFTLVEQDITAPRLIVEWIKENLENMNMSGERLHEALQIAIEMRSYAHRRSAD